MAHLTPAQRKAYILADNKLALNAGWDDELLGLELGELQGLDFDLGLTGFDGAELSKLMFPEDLPQSEPPATSTKEIDPDEYEMGCKCPRCGFEFNDDK